MFKEYILEKLKVTKFSGTEIPTYQEYYDLLIEYSKTVSEGCLNVGELYGYDSDLLPKYEKDKSKTIYSIIPLHSLSSSIIRFRMFDYTLNQSVYSDISINHVKDKEVDFMTDEYVEKTVKYMEEHIK